MKETYHIEQQAIPTTLCERCGEWCTSQEFTLTLTRPKVTRVTHFCSMACLRKWVAPIR